MKTNYLFIFLFVPFINAVEAENPSEHEQITRTEELSKSDIAQKKMGVIWEKIKPSLYKNAYFLDNLNDDLIKTVLCLACFQSLGDYTPNGFLNKIVLTFIRIASLGVGSAHALRLINHMTEDTSVRKRLFSWDTTEQHEEALQA